MNFKYMEVVIIGTGNVATVLSKLMFAKGHSIVEIVGRDAAKTLAIANLVGATANNTFSNIYQNAAIYIIAVSDDALVGVIKQLAPTNALIVHTAGSISKDILQLIGDNHGVLWPLQTLRKEIDVVPEIPFVIDASNEVSILTLEQFAKSLSPVCFRANDAARIKLHLGAVIVSNFSNHLYALADAYFAKEALDFSLLLPLIQETVERIKHHAPKDVQTGPAVRGDIATMKKHVQLLVEDDNLQQIYMMLSNSIAPK